MSNVKPGDMARVVARGDRSSNETAGTQVLVIESARSNDPFVERYIRMASKQFGQMWSCQLLQSVRHPYEGIVKAGEIAHFADQCLRRIDPPADSLDLYRIEPTPQEKLEQEFRDKGIEIVSIPTVKEPSNARTT